MGPDAGFQLAQPDAPTLPPRPEQQQQPQQQQQTPQQRRWPLLLSLLALPLLPLLLLAPLALPLFFVARPFYRRHLAARRAAARLLSRPLTAAQVTALLGARPLFVPPRALAASPDAAPPTVDESLGWLNALLEQLWPALDRAAASAVASAVQPLLDASRPPFVRALGFEQLTLGALPVRVDRLRLLDPASPPLLAGGGGGAGGGQDGGGGRGGAASPSSFGPPAGVAVEADVAWAGHANVSFFVDLAPPAPAAGGGSAGATAPPPALLRLTPRVEDLGLRGVLRLALSPAHGGGGGGGAEQPRHHPPRSPRPPPPPLPAALVVSFARPPTVRFALRFARALALPGVVAAVVEPPVQAFLDDALREALCGLLVWPQRVVLPLAPLLRRAAPPAGKAGGQGEEEGGGGGASEMPADGLLDAEDAALDALHVRSVGLLRVEALGARRGGGGEEPGAPSDLPGSGLGQSLELECWTEPSSRARLTVPTATTDGGGGGGGGGGKASSTAAATTASQAPPPAALAAAAAGAQSTSASGGALPSPSAAGGAAGGAPPAAELLVQEPRSQRARLSVRVADALAAPRALLRGDVGAGAAALFGGAEQRRSERVGRASLPLAALVPLEERGASAPAAAAARVTEGWFALSPADEDWEDIEQDLLAQQEAAGDEDDEGEGDDDEDEDGASTAAATTTTPSAASATAAAAAAAAAASAAASPSGQPPLQLRLRLTYLPLAPPSAGSPVPARGGVLRVAVRRARRLPPLSPPRAEEVHSAVVDVGAAPPPPSPSPAAAAAAAAAPGPPPDPSARRRTTGPSPFVGAAPAWRARFEFGGCLLGDAVRVAVFSHAPGSWGAPVPRGQAVVPLALLLGIGGTARRGGEGAAAAAAAPPPLSWPPGEWRERRLGAAEGWADLLPADGGGGGAGGQVLVRLEYASAGEAAMALAGGVAEA